MEHVEAALSGIITYTFFQARRAQKPDESKKALQVFLSMKQDADAHREEKLQDKLKRAAKESREND